MIQVDPVDTVKVQLAQLLGSAYLPETRVCCAVTHQIFTVASIAGTSIPSPPDSDNEEGTDEDGEEDGEEDEEKLERRRAKEEKRDRFEARRRAMQAPADRPGEFEVVAPWGLVISPQGLDLLRANDVVGLYAIEREVMHEPPMTWTRLISITGQVLDEHPSHEIEEEDDEGLEGEEAIEAAAELGRKLRKLVCAAVCADKRVPTDKAMQDEQPPDFTHIPDAEERTLEQLKWRLEQKEQMLRMLEADPSEKPFEPGPMCFRCARWMRTDRDVVRCRASGRQGALFVEAMEALLWGERAQAARALCAPLARIWRSTFRGLHRVGWLFGPRQWRREILQVMPTPLVMVTSQCGIEE